MNEVLLKSFLDGLVEAKMAIAASPGIIPVNENDQERNTSDVRRFVGKNIGLFDAECRSKPTDLPASFRWLHPGSGRPKIKLSYI